MMILKMTSNIAHSTKKEKLYLFSSGFPVPSRNIDCKNVQNLFKTLFCSSHSTLILCFVPTIVARWQDCQLNIIFLKNGPTPASFYLFSSFSQNNDKFSIQFEIKLNKRRFCAGIRTQGRRMKGWQTQTNPLSSCSINYHQQQ